MGLGLGDDEFLDDFLDDELLDDFLDDDLDFKDLFLIFVNILDTFFFVWLVDIYINNIYFCKYNIYYIEPNIFTPFSHLS